MTTERVTQVTIETVTKPEQVLRVTQSAIETVTEPEQVLRVTQVCLEVLTVVPVGEKHKARIL